MIARRSAWEWRGEGEEDRAEKKKRGVSKKNSFPGREKKIKKIKRKKVETEKEKSHPAVFVLEREDPVAVQVEHGADVDGLVGLGAAAAGCFWNERERERERESRKKEVS